MDSEQNTRRCAPTTTLVCVPVHRGAAAATHCYFLFGLRVPGMVQRMIIFCGSTCETKTHGGRDKHIQQGYNNMDKNRGSSAVGFFLAPRGDPNWRWIRDFYPCCIPVVEGP